jgi:hypothetical protein
VNFTIHEDKKRLNKIISESIKRVVKGKGTL